MINLFNHFHSAKVLILGDFMLDVYTIGKVHRISPEAPVSVLHVEEENQRPGGAGNAILNLVSLGMEVVAVGRVGNDSSGQTLLQALANENIDTRGIVVDPHFSTPVKNRLIAENQQMVRVDYEKITPLSKEMEEKIIERLPLLLEDVNVIAISDYAKGFVTPRLLEHLFIEASARKIPTIVDPKGSNFSKYRGATLIKPNQSEAYAAAGLPLGTPLEQVAAQIFNHTEVEFLVITRSKDGISLFDRSLNHINFPVNIKEVKDVTGAGDTVLSMLTASMACGLDLHMAIQLANISAGIAIERFGCARVSLKDVAKRLLEINPSHKIFSESDLFVLQSLLMDQEFILLSIEAKRGFTAHLFKSIQELVKKFQKPLLLYIRDKDADPELIQLLSSLVEVDYLLLRHEEGHVLSEHLHPKAIFALDNQSLFQLGQLKELLSIQV